MARYGVQSKIRYAAKLRVATLNVRSLYHSTVQKQIRDYMRQHNIDVIMMQETRAPQTTQFCSDDYLYVLCGSGHKRGYAGVGFVVGPR
eukprot:13600780-Alexandrium_andersonii.AAC.1